MLPEGTGGCLVSTGTSFPSPALGPSPHRGWTPWDRSLALLGFQVSPEHTSCGQVKVESRKVRGWEHPALPIRQLPAAHSTKRGQFEKTTQLLISQCMARDASCHKHHSAKGNASDSCEEGFAEQKTWAAIPLCSKNAAKPRCQQPPAASTASLLLLQALPSLWRQCSSSCHVILRP